MKRDHKTHEGPHSWTGQKTTHDLCHTTHPDHTTTRLQKNDKSTQQHNEKKQPCCKTQLHTPTVPHTTHTHTRQHRQHTTTLLLLSQAYHTIPLNKMCIVSKPLDDWEGIRVGLSILSAVGGKRAVRTSSSSSSSTSYIIKGEEELDKGRAAQGDGQRRLQVNTPGFMKPGAFSTPHSSQKPEKKTNQGLGSQSQWSRE